MQRDGAKTRPPKGQRTKKAGATGKTPAHSSVDPTPEQLMDRLRRERDEAVELQAASAEVLEIIGSSPGDMKPVFEAMLGKALRICDAKFGHILLYDGECFHAVHLHDVPPSYRAFWDQHGPIRPDPRTALGQLAGAKQIVHIPDLKADRAYTERQPLRVVTVDEAGARSFLGVPMLKENKLAGAIVIYRREVRPFANKQIELVKTFAAQAVIAIENTRLFNETQEALERQIATAEILKVIASSPSDVGPVFDAIVNSAAQLFEPCAATIIILRDGKLHWEAQAAGHSERDFSGAKAIFPIPFDPDRSVSARAILERRIIEIPDTEAADTPEFVRKASHAGGFRNGTYVPLILSDRGIGVFVLTHPQAGFKLAEKQIALAQTFADQAVIAIENARLFNEVQAKTADLQESLQQQTATADVLKVISRSAFDLQAVLGTLTESATELCNADMGSIARKDERGYYHATAYRFAVDWVRVTDPLRLQPGRDSVVGRVLLEKKAVQIADVLVDAEYNYPDMQKAAGYRALLGVPLMRQGQPIGVLFLGRRTVEPFTDKQVELVSTFADQAVIAIQNVELFEEVQAKTRDLSEALTYQTGSSNILRVIASSPSDVGPVLKAIVENACELCDAYDCAVSLKDGEYMHFSAHHGPIPLILDKWPINRNWTVGRAFLDRKPVHLHDVLSAEGDEFPDGQELSRIMGHRTILSVPLVREGEGIGAVTLRRTEVYPFSDKQIALLQSFADQAVIAIENARLFNEVQAKTRDLTESLDQQIATSEVLKAISHSAFDLQPVFDAIAENSVKLCHAERAFIFRFDGQFLRAISSFNVGPEVKRFVDQNPIALGRHSISARAGIEQRTVHVADVHADPEYAYAVRDVDLIRTILAVPMLKSDELVGVITIYRLEVKPFTEKQVSLVETFAAQAVIAVENTRLINELRQSLDDLRATQDRLVQTQKLASLGQLTAGIAHEIKNPLNFVNNFSGMSAELIGELQDVVSGLAIEPEAHADIKELTDILSANLGKIVQHGKRADAIVRSMLLHSGQTSGEHRLIDINALVDESLNRAYYGERAETRGFAIKLEKSFDPAVGEVDLFPREIGRAILNLISNGFYATSKRKEAEGSDYEPVLVAATRNLGDRVEIRIRDNGWGIPADVKEKMFDPFFTTKPAGEGTGLGLSITHDIIVKQHGGSIEVDTKPGEFAEIRLILPRTGALLSEGQ